MKIIFQVLPNKNCFNVSIISIDKIKLIHLKKCIKNVEMIVLILMYGIKTFSQKTKLLN